MAYAILLSHRNNLEIFPDNPFVMLRHKLVLLQCHVGGLYGVAVLIADAHVKLSDSHELARFGHKLKHLDDMLFLAPLGGRVEMIADVHLASDTVNLGDSIAFPLLNPLYEAFQFLVVVPIAFKVIVVDEKLEIGRIPTIFLEILAGKPDRYTCEIITKVILPIELVRHVARLCSRMLEVVTLAPRSSLDGLIDNIPIRHITLSRLHHTFHPTFHLVGQHLGLLFGCEFYGISALLNLKLNIVDIEETSCRS